MLRVLARDGKYIMQERERRMTQGRRANWGKLLYLWPTINHISGCSYPYVISSHVNAGLDHTTGFLQWDISKWMQADSVLEHSHLKASLYDLSSLSIPPERKPCGEALEDEPPGRERETMWKKTQDVPAQHLDECCHPQVRKKHPFHLPNCHKQQVVVT